ncbi:MAG: hypothetical protein E7500_08565 [Ruminococcus sp.]|nr:hypothetical protein [Ruminococcus sp.]
MKIKRTASALLAVCSAGLLTAGIVTYAIDNQASLKDASLENSFIRLTVDQHSEQSEYLQFRLATTGGKTGNQADDNKNITYRNFCSGYTTISINGENYVYGRGVDTSQPEYNAEKKCHTSSQKFGDVEIRQELTFAEGYTPGYEDMLNISYTVLNAGENDSIGVRVLIDPAIADDDTLRLSADNVSISKEAVFAEKLPSDWKAEMSNDSSVSAYGKLSGSALMPSSITFADWYNIYDSLWDYSPDINYAISDASVAVKWEPVKNPVNTVFSTKYGIRNTANTGTDNNAQISSPKTSTKTVVRTAVFMLIAVVSAFGSYYFSRKEKKNAQ